MPISANKIRNSPGLHTPGTCNGGLSGLSSFSQQSTHANPCDFPVFLSRGILTSTGSPYCMFSSD
eukprot:768498-Hanusia_phi.AAC.4